MRIPIPLPDSFFKTFLISSIAIGSIPAKGSSKSIILGFAASVLAISTFLLYPPQSCLPFNFVMSDKPNSSIELLTKSVMSLLFSKDNSANPKRFS